MSAPHKSTLYFPLISDGVCFVMEQWDHGDIYEIYMGRWSRLIAREFVASFFTPRKRWLDIGCGTGALTQAILDLGQPEQVVSSDRSAGFVQYTSRTIQDGRVQFAVADAVRLPFVDGAFSQVVSGLVLNFMPESAVGEMRRVVGVGGRVAAYVWDYAGKMEWLRYFWDAAIAVDSAAVKYDEGQRFPICQPDRLRDVFAKYGLGELVTAPIDIPTHFESFEAYWQPFLRGQFPAPQYVASLDEAQRTTLRDDLHQRVPVNPDGSIDLIARAWAVCGIVAL